MLAGLPSCKFFRDKVFGKKERALAAELARQESIRVADSIRKAQDYLLAAKKARLDSIRIADEKKLETGNKYNIIVGSFITPEYARSLSEEYNKMGYNTQLIKPGDSKFELVAAESHEDIRMAIKRLEAFQDTVHVESWIYIRQ